jgi:transcriptional regulator with XRE-family HTH domain
MATFAPRLDDPAVGNLGKNLRAARDRLGITQEEVAARSGVQAGEISRIERGKRDPQVSTLEKIAAAVEMPPGRLLDQPVPGPPSTSIETSMTRRSG